MVLRAVWLGFDQRRRHEVGIEEDVENLKERVETLEEDAEELSWPNYKGEHVLAAMCLLGAIVIAVSGHDGWGWLLFVAVLIL